MRGTRNRSLVLTKSSDNGQKHEVFDEQKLTEEISKVQDILGYKFLQSNTKFMAKIPIKTGQASIVKSTDIDSSSKIRPADFLNQNQEDQIISTAKKYFENYLNLESQQKYEDPAKNISLQKKFSQSLQTQSQKYNSSSFLSNARDSDWKKFLNSEEMTYPTSTKYRVKYDSVRPNPRVVRIQPERSVSENLQMTSAQSSLEKQRVTEKAVCKHLRKMVKPIVGPDIQNFLQYDTQFTSATHHLIVNKQVGENNFLNDSILKKCHSPTERFQLVINSRAPPIKQTKPSSIEIRIQPLPRYSAKKNKSSVSVSSIQNQKLKFDENTLKPKEQKQFDNLNNISEEEPAITIKTDSDSSIKKLAPVRTLNRQKNKFFMKGRALFDEKFQSTPMIQYDYDLNKVRPKQRVVSISKPSSMVQLAETGLQTTDKERESSDYYNSKGWVRQDKRVGRDVNWLLLATGPGINVIQENKIKDEPPKSRDHKKSCFTYEFADQFDDFKSVIKNM